MRHFTVRRTLKICHSIQRADKKLRYPSTTMTTFLSLFLAFSSLTVSSARWFGTPETTLWGPTRFTLQKSGSSSSSSIRMPPTTQRGGGAVKNYAASRGGDTIAAAAAGAVEPYVAVSTVTWAVGATQTAPGCQLLATKQKEQQPLWNGIGVNWNNSPALWKALAFLSDITVLVLNTQTPIALELVQALESGLTARLHQDLPKGRLVIVLECDDSEFAAWKQRLDQDLIEAKPRLVSDLEIVHVSESSKVLLSMHKRIRNNSGGVSHLADAETFPRLVQQVFRAFGGDGKVDLKEQQPQKQQQAANLQVTKEGAQVEINLVQKASEYLEELQRKQEEALLDTGAMPINFASNANAALTKIEKELLNAASPVVAEAVKKQVVIRMRELDQQQLEALRNQYGKMYETALDKSKDSPETWKDAAVRVTERFRKAVEQATPTLLKEGKMFEDSELSYRRALAESGLISDMMEATDLRQDDSFVSDGTLDDSPNRRRLTKWYKKLAARALVVGVNYLQGWLAWQGIKRAAILREQQMPKFPLF